MSTTYMNAYLVAGSQVRRSTRMHFYYFYAQPAVIRYSKNRTPKIFSKDKICMKTNDNQLDCFEII